MSRPGFTLNAALGKQNCAAPSKIFLGVSSESQIGHGSNFDWGLPSFDFVIEFDPYIDYIHVGPTCSYVLEFLPRPSERCRPKQLPTLPIGKSRPDGVPFYYYNRGALSEDSTTRQVLPGRGIEVLELGGQDKRGSSSYCTFVIFKIIIRTSGKNFTQSFI